MQRIGNLGLFREVVLILVSIMLLAPVLNRLVCCLGRHVTVGSIVRNCILQDLPIFPASSLEVPGLETTWPILLLQYVPDTVCASLFEYALHLYKQNSE